MKLKKVLAVACAVALVGSLAACGNNTAVTDDVADSGSAAMEQGEVEAVEVSSDSEVSVFYYTYSDTYISSVRADLDAALDDAGVNYTDYDGNNSQTTQTEQVQTALSKGSSLLVVNLVDSGSDDAAGNIIDLASAQNVPVIFFNRSVSEEVVTSYGSCVFVGTDYEQAGHMQGELVGNYLVENYDAVDLNGDGVISYVMLKGDEGNAEAIARTKYGQEDADAVLEKFGYPAMSYYDPNASSLYLLDQTGSWSSAQGNDLMQTVLSQFSEANGNMVEVVIANNDDMALGAISALQNAGYNTGDGTYIPVFGVDATEAAQAAINEGSMTGTIKQDAEGMATTICQVVTNMKSGVDSFEGVNPENVVGTWRVNIPYGTYTAE
ncbi:MAG: galactose ABC transporter substrate-binding protein [Clostridiales bacterium]|nr:galactose ABC transporter substrate-binding protein [Clostridiales bacterium]